MLRKLLQQNLSIPQLLGYSFTALIGMSIIFAAFGFSVDIQPVFSPNTGLFKSEYMTVTKKVSVISAFNSGNTVFTDDEISEIESQPFVSSVSFFTPCKYSVVAYTIPTGSIPAFSTEMFFESVPDRLLDGAGPEWKWENDTNFIPVIIPRDYLALYNFGFAGSRGLPQISEDIVKTISFNVSIRGNSKREVYKGRIVGFSDYLNTILVPQAFMDWANENFGNNEPVKISRLIVEVVNPADPAIAEFFAKTGYEVSENKGEQGKLSYFLKIIITILSVIGLLILLPAMGLMFLSINLLIYKNRKTLGNLILLGYTRRQLAKPYNMLVTILNVAIGCVSFVIFLILRGIYLPKLLVINIEQSSIELVTIFFVFLFIILVTFINILWIRRKISLIKPPVRG